MKINMMSLRRRCYIVILIGSVCVCVVVCLLLESEEQGHIVPGVALALHADTALSSTAS